MTSRPPFTKGLETEPVPERKIKNRIKQKKKKGLPSHAIVHSLAICVFLIKKGDGCTIEAGQEKKLKSVLAGAFFVVSVGTFTMISLSARSR